MYWPAAYAIASGAALLMVVLLWQPSGVGLYSLTGLSRHVAQGLGIAAVGLFVWGLLSLKSFDPLGVAGIARHLRSRPAQPCGFAVRGPYRFVRHPLYLAIIVALWSCPDVTADRLLLDVLWTAWIVVGTVLEEADLVAEIGDAYRAYRRTVPMLLPWPDPGASWMGSRGEAYVVIQLVLVAIIAFGPRSCPGLPAWPGSATSVAGVALLAIGSLLAIAGIAALGRNLTATPRPKPGATLVEHGPYRFVRHPMYAGAVLAAFGWALTIHGWLTLAYAAVLFVFFDVKARREERWLREEIPGYAAYERRVRKLIPFIY
jgi:protein-S-isoprenylcysteine O-methyltransferase Ste14